MAHAAPKSLMLLRFIPASSCEAHLHECTRPANAGIFGQPLCPCINWVYSAAATGLLNTQGVLSFTAANHAVKTRHTLLRETQLLPRFCANVFCLFSAGLLRLGACPRNRRTRRSTFAYIAGVSSPVCVFCWLG